VKSDPKTIDMLINLLEDDNDDRRLPQMSARDTVSLIEDLQSFKQGPVCVWCGEHHPAQALATVEAGLDEITLHARTCKNSPWRAFEALMRRFVEIVRKDPSGTNDRDVERFQNTMLLALDVLDVVDAGHSPDVTKIRKLIDQIDACDVCSDGPCQDTVSIDSPCPAVATAPPALDVHPADCQSCSENDGPCAAHEHDVRYWRGRCEDAETALRIKS
jgi:hypothetical protein